MHLNDSDQDFDCVLEVKRIWEFVRISQTQDQSDTVEVPKLGGSMGFSILDNLELNDLASFSPLTTPMGGYQKVMFDFGDYNPSGNKLILPYNVPGFNQGSLGELTGTFVNGHYQGTWFSKPFGEVGTFDLEQVGSRDGKDVQH